MYVKRYRFFFSPLAFSPHSRRWDVFKVIVFLASSAIPEDGGCKGPLFSGEVKAVFFLSEMNK